MAQADQSRFARLVDLANATSSDQRRDLLRGVTDLFFEFDEPKSKREIELFDTVLRLVANDMQDSILVELAERFAGAPDAPIQLMRDLANHAIAVATPVLRQSEALTDHDLISIVQDRGEEHRRAIAQRPTVSAALSEAIVARGDDKTVDCLLQNSGAQFSRETFEAITDRAQKNSALHAAFVARADMPIDLLNELYFVVEARLRDAILTRNSAIDPALLDAAMGKARTRLSASTIESAAQLRDAAAFIEKAKRAKTLTPSLLVALFREGHRDRFIFGLAEITNLEYETAAQIIERKDVDALAMICRAADVDRPLFVTIAAFIFGGDHGMAQAEAFGKLYHSVPREAAQRAMRFYRVRRGADEPHALVA